jgi:hypothetical protein
MCDVQITEPNMDDTDKALASLNAGDDALLVCEVYGDPEPTIYWSFGNKKITINNKDEKYVINETPPSPHRNIIDEDQQRSSTLYSTSSITNKTSQLRIRNLQVTDIGVYVCTAEIPGTTNRREISYNLKGLKGAGLLTGGGISLSDAGLVVGDMSNVLAAATSSLFNEPLSNWTLLILFGIVCSLIVFVLVLSLLICWRCRRAVKRRQLGRDVDESTIKQFNASKSDPNYDNKIANDGQNGPLILSTDEIDYNTKYRTLQNQQHHSQSHSQQQQQQHHLNNPDNGGTLINGNKVTNSIRMAYPNTNTINQYHAHHGSGHHNDIYTNNSLLTTTASTATTNDSSGGSSQQQSSGTTIAIDTSNNTPRYHLIQPNSNNTNNNESSYYYDDLRYNSNCRVDQQNPQNSYSPIRRDDPTVPLYATMKPKLRQQQQQQQQQMINYNNLNQHSIDDRIPPSFPLSKLHYQQLPPPPPPPPPLKPKRTFEHNYSNDPSNNINPANHAVYSGYHLGMDLNSDSGTYLLSDQNNLNNNYIPDTDSSSQQMTNGSRMTNDDNQSGTSMDEEDLDLTDLKDFEDVTFDNLRRPGQQQRLTSSGSSNLDFNKLKNSNSTNNNNKINNSEQSLFLKSSSIDSDTNTIHNSNNNNNNNTCEDVLIAAHEKWVKDGDTVMKTAVSSTKVYEETEI